MKTHTETPMKVINSLDTYFEEIARVAFDKRTGDRPGKPAAER